MDSLLQIIGGISLFIGTLYTCIKLFYFWRSGRTELIASVELFELKWPPFITEHEKNLKEIFSIKNINKITEGLDYETAQKITTRMEEHFQSTNATNFSCFLRENENIWKITVNNKSKKTYEDVVLKIRECFAARIKRGSMSNTIQDDASVLKLGDIRGKEEVTVYAWGRGSLDLWSDHGITINHKNGIGMVRGLYPSPRWARLLCELVYSRHFYIFRIYIIFVFISSIILLTALIGITKNTPETKTIMERPADVSVEGETSVVPYE